MSDPTNPTNSWESAANDAVDGAKNTANKGIDAAENAANNAVDSAESVANNAVDSAKNAANNAVDSAENVANNAVDSAKNVVNNAVDSATSAVSNAVDSATGAVSNAVDSATSAVSNAVSSATSVASNAVDSAKAVVDKAKDVVSALGGGGGGVTALVTAAAGGGAAGAVLGALGGGNPLASLRSPSVSRSLAALGGGGGGGGRGGAVRPQKAIIKNLDGTSPAEVVCQYNPKEYTISKQNKWSAAKTQSANDVPQFEFSGGDPMSLKVQLFFDTTETESDVSGLTKDLFTLMMVSEKLKNPKTNKSRPPRVCLIWSNTPSFESVITSASQKFTLFRSDGTPLRATVDVTFQQISDPNQYPPQNPTSGGDGGEQLWAVKTGDTLAWISYKVYGDSTRWRLIADANRLLDVRRLTPGMTLVIPNA
jgi:nucleoid-associated protein YgaU